VAIVNFVVAGELKFECHVFEVDEFSGEPIETEEMRPGWYDLSNLPYERMHGGDKVWLKRVLEGEKFRANVYYRGLGEGLEKVEFLDF
jgi:hypothetical protein